MYVEQIATGGDRNFGYIVADESSRHAALVDPSYAPQRLVERCNDLGFEVVCVLVTHDHHDHTNGNRVVKELTGADVVMHESARSHADVQVVDGDELSLGALTVKVIGTPGHTPDAVCYLAGNALFTGDTLFVSKVGGTDLGKGAERQYRSLHDKVMTLPGATRVLPGHDVGTQPESTVDRERRTNPFLTRRSLYDFVDLKRNWPEYKRQHGIE